MQSVDESQVASRARHRTAAPRRVPWLPALLALIVATGLAVRLYDIGDKSLWLDESFSIWMAARPVPDLLRYTVELDTHPPVYYLLLKAWIGVFGDGEAAVRGLSVLFGVATLPVVYLIGAQVRGRALGLLAAAVLALAPLHVEYAQQARMYAMLTFFAAVATLCALRLLDEPASAPLLSWWWGGFVAATTLTMLAHNTAVFFTAAIGLLVAGGYLAKALRPALRRVGLGLAAAVAAWLAWLPSFLAQSSRVDGEFWIPPPTGDKVVEHVLDLSGGWVAVGSAFQLPLVVAFLLLAGLGGWWLRRRPLALALLVLLLLVPPAGELLVSLRRPIFYSQTLIWTSVPFSVLVAAGLLALRQRVAVAVAAGLVLALSVASMADYYGDVAREDWRTAAAAVAAQAAPGDLVLFNAGWTQIPFDYYYDGPPVVEHGLPANLFERGKLETPMATADLPRLDGLIAGRSRVWLVYSHEWYTDPMGIIPGRLGEVLALASDEEYTHVRVLRFDSRPT